MVSIPTAVRAQSCFFFLLEWIMIGTTTEAIQVTTLLYMWLKVTCNCLATPLNTMLSGYHRKYNLLIVWEKDALHHTPVGLRRQKKNNTQDSCLHQVIQF